MLSKKKKKKNQFRFWESIALQNHKIILPKCETKGSLNSLPNDFLSSSSSWIFQRTWPYIQKPVIRNFCQMKNVEKIKDNGFLENAPPFEKSFMIRVQSQKTSVKYCSSCGYLGQDLILQRQGVS